MAATSRRRKVNTALEDSFLEVGGGEETSNRLLVAAAPRSRQADKPWLRERTLNLCRKARFCLYGLVYRAGKWESTASHP